jgi:exoribonuclease R
VLARDLAEEEWGTKLESSETRSRASLSLLKARLEEAYNVNERAEGKATEVTAWKESTFERLREELRVKANEAAAATSELKRIRAQLTQRVNLLLHERDQAMQFLEENGCCAHCDRVQGAFSTPKPQDRLYSTPEDGSARLIG